MTAEVVVSGGTGYVGRFIVERLLSEGRRVAVLGRTPPPEGFFGAPVEFFPVPLDAGPVSPAPFAGARAFVHAAFDHLPGRYRGGEGSDPEGFRRRNLEGSVALLEAARQAGVGRAVFLSSRAVYGTQPAGMELTEETPPRPDTLYGEVKLAVERHLAGMASPAFCPVLLRVTGVYGPAGPGRSHKWQSLFDDFLAGVPVEPRIATEVHGDDVAAAVSLLLEAAPATACGRIFNVSDLRLDRRELLGLVAAAAGVSLPLPAPADGAGLNAMSTARLQALGWRPGGRALLRRTVGEMVAAKLGRPPRA